MNGPQDTIPDGNAQSEELIAYLDGELNAEQRRRLEEQLSSNSTLRQHLKELQQTWDMLDDLPRDQVDETFTRSTVEMVAIHAEQEVSQRLSRAAQRRAAAWLGGIAATVLAGAVGFWVTYENLSRPNRRLIEDLPIVEHLDAYQYAGSIEFLRELEREQLFSEEDSGDR